MPKVSIIMPAYNAEKYISIAIESVIKQSYLDWELIIVDDCAKDRTGVICDNYSQCDNRVKVLHLEKNVGISKAKNIALDYASGEYITFCDDDDVMHSKTLEDNINLVKKNNAEIVRWTYRTIKVNGDGEVVDVIEKKCTDKIYDNREEIFRDYNNIHTLLSCDWTGLYSRDFLNRYHIRFNKNYQYGGEDTEFNIITLQYVNRMIVNSEIYYDWYLRRNHSTTAKRNINFVSSMIEVANKEHSLLRDNSEEAFLLWEKYEKDYISLITDYSKRLPEDDLRVAEQLMSERKW